MENPMTNILLYLAIGLTIGSISGILGIGGGVLLVPALIWICDLDAKKAIGTTLAILVPPIGLPAAWRYYSSGMLDLPAALWIAGAFAVGAYLGATAAPHLNQGLVRMGFGLGMMYIAIRFLVASDSYATQAAAGLTSVVLAYLGFVGLRMLGRRAVPLPPTLTQQIQLMHQQGRGESDYHI
jgi:uncharacterized membrane protein YfcA